MIDSVSANQNIFGKYFNYGTIMFNGRNGISKSFIEFPVLFRQRVNEAIVINIKENKSLKDGEIVNHL
jgi:hypothetical protein